MKWLAACGVIIFWTVGAFAAPVEVRTGEHVGFTRVVLTIPEGADWQFGRTPEGYALRLPITEGYALQRFFDLIPQTRISAVTQNIAAGELRLQVRCECNAQAYLFRPDVLVVDVRDGLPRRISSSELSFDAPRQLPLLDFPQALARPYTISRSRIFPVIFGRSSEVSIAQPSGNIEQFEVTDNALASLAATPIQAAQGDLHSLEESIVEGLGRALTDGFLDSELRRSGLDLETRQEFIRTGQRAELGYPGVIARTSVDRMAVPKLDSSSQTQSGQSCLPDSYFDVASWGDHRVFSDQLNDARRALVPEFEDADPEAIINLARLYIYFGFGREAEQTLDLDQAQSQQRQYLLALARIVDNRRSVTDLFEEQVSCVGPVALWSVLALQPPSFGAQVEVPSVLRAFRMLPNSLQAVLGPRLSERLLSVGAKDAAFQVLNAQRDADTHTIDRVMAQAALLEVLGEQNAAIAAVASAARRDSRATPELIIRFFQDGAESGYPFSDDDFTLINATRFEQSGTPIGSKLAIAQVDAYSSVGRYEDAVRLLLQVETSLDPVLKSQLFNDILIDATGQLPDVEFLRFVFQQDVEAIGLNARNSIAARLLNMGFPLQAQKFLEDQASGIEAERQRYLGAQAAQALSEPELAIESFRNQLAERAQQKQREVAGEVQMQELFVQTTTGSSIETFAATSDQNVQEFDGRAEEIKLPVLDPQQPLTESRALLELSMQSRIRLEGLLERFDVPEGF